MSHGIPSKIKDALSKLWVWIVICLTLLIFSVILVAIFPSFNEENIKSKVGEVIDNKDNNKSFFSLPAPGSISFKLFGSTTSGGVAKPIIRPYTEDYSSSESNNFWNQTSDWNKLGN
jgi:hypothetical protein